ncbi:MAG: hypothetical protein GXO57_08780 [Thermodesulfobacteria bacterium]|nr:hypothetical protein [Thermodesulfobacteriota bacterium]
MIRAKGLRFYFELISVVFLVLIFQGCMQSKPKCVVPQGPEPFSRQATFIESTSTGESMVRATGKGCTFNQATLDAKRVAIWYLLYAGDKPILKTPDAKRKAKPIVDEILSNPDLYIRWQSDVKDKRYEGPYVLVTYLFKVDVNALKQKLIDAGVIAPVEQLAEEVGLPTIAVIPEAQKPGIGTAVTVFQEYLQDRDFEVYVPEQNTVVNKIVKKVATLEGNVDPYYAMALQLGSDVYIRVNVDVAEMQEYGKVFKKASVRAVAFETATGKQIGATTGYSPAREVVGIDAIVEEAAHDAADKITSQITKSWIKEARKGRPFKVVVLTTPDEMSQVDEAIYFGVFKKLTHRPIKRTASGKSIAAYVVYIKGVSNAYELFMKMKELYHGPGSLQKVMDAGSFLIIKAGSNPQEIVVE